MTVSAHEALRVKICSAWSCTEEAEVNDLCTYHAALAAGGPSHQGDWTPELVLEAVRKWAREHGRPPKSAEWQLMRRGSDYPSYNACIRMFPLGWAAMLAAAALPDDSEDQSIVSTAESDRTPEDERLHHAHIAPVSGYCMATVNLGPTMEGRVRCSRRATLGEFCGQHASRASETREEQTPPSEPVEKPEEPLTWEEKDARLIEQAGPEIARLIRRYGQLTSELADCTMALDAAMTPIRKLTDEWIVGELGGDPLGQEQQ